MKAFLALAVFGLSLICAGQTQAQNHRQTAIGKICGNPNVRCKTSTEFEVWDLPFEVPRNGVIWESEAFYVVMLQSVPAHDDCSGFIAESDRLAVQAKFPNNKVFASRCAEAGNIYYSNTSSNHNFMAVFAGRTNAEAQKVLAAAKAAGFSTANVRRMRTGFNGT
jgi:hypothetical protein